MSTTTVPSELRRPPNRQLARWTAAAMAAPSAARTLGRAAGERATGPILVTSTGGR